MHDLFGTVHLISLAICLPIIILSIFISKKIKLATVIKILLIGGIISETIKVFFYVIHNIDKFDGWGYLPKGDLPFHLCSIQIILIIILYFSKNENLKKLLMSFMLPTCLIGGFAALLIATYSSRNFPIITIQYFGFHTMIVCFAIFLLRTNEVEFTVKDYIHSLVMLFACFFVAIYLNSWIRDGDNSVNFMYVSGPPQEGLPYLNLNQGWFVYILRYFALALLCDTLVYIVPIIKWIKGKAKKNKLVEE